MNATRKVSGVLPDGHPTAHLETQPHFKKPGSATIVIDSRLISQMPDELNFMADIRLLSPDCTINNPIYCGKVDDNIVVSTNNDLIVESYSEQWRRKHLSDCCSHYDVPIRRGISRILEGDYRPMLCESTRIVLGRYNMDCSPDTMRQDNRRNLRGRLNLKQLRIALCISAVLWHEITQRCHIYDIPYHPYDELGEYHLISI